MAIYQILYWQDIPSQVKAWDDFDEVKISLAPRFMEQIDQVAKRKGLTKTDDYLAQWNWSEQQERAGDPDEVAKNIKGELETKS